MRPLGRSGAWKSVLRALVAVVFLGVVYAMAAKQGSWSEVRVRHWGWVVAATALAFGSVWVKGAKWQIVARALAPSVTLGDGVRSYVGALPYSLVTPGRVGEAARVLYLPQPELRSISGVGLVFLDKIIDLVALLWWVAAGALAAGVASRYSLVLLALALGLTPLGAWMPLVHGGLTRLRFAKGIAGKLAEAMADARRLPPRDLAVALVLGLISFGIEFVQYWAMFNALAPGSTYLPFNAIVLYMALITLANAFQISMGGLGVREGLSALAFAKQLAPTAAALAPFTVFLLDQALPGLVGLALKPGATADEEGGDRGAG